METEKYQKELFEFESPGKSAPRFGSIFPRTDLAITLTPEKIVFAAIGVVMLIVIFFALGVEKGRSAAYAKLAEVKTITREIVATPAVSVKPALGPIAVSSNAIATNIMPKVNPPASAVKARMIFDKAKPYTVVAAAFSRQDLALKEAGKLKTAGLEAFVYYGEPYYLACVGSFQNKEMAEKVLNKVKHMRKDAYVRLR